MEKSLYTIAIIVALVVIFAMALAFSVLFYLYSKYKLKVIENGLEDGTLMLELKTAYAKTAKENESVRAWLVRKAKTEKNIQTISNVLYGIMITILIVVFAISLTFRIGGSEFFLGDTAYYTVQTGSMQELNSQNPYYKDLPKGDDARIMQGTLVTIEKAEEDELKLYDVIAFKEKGKVYIHRIVNIKETNEGKLFTTMGDSNSGSFLFERNMPYSKIVGRLGSFKSFGLGVVITYLESNIGIISMIFAMLMLVFMDISECRISKRYDTRMYDLAEMFDSKTGEEICEIRRSMRCLPGFGSGKRTFTEEELAAKGAIGLNWDELEKSDIGDNKDEK